MKRGVQRFGAYALVIVFGALLLALELGFITGAAAAIVGIVSVIRTPVSPREGALSMWRVAVTGVYGLLALLFIILAMLFAYWCVRTWKTVPRQPAGTPPLPTNPA